MKAADETARLARVRYEKGLASYFEVVEADRTVLTTKLTLAQIDGQRSVVYGAADQGAGRWVEALTSKAIGL